MSLPRDITADLPPPGDDEPASLRRDIVDELADHLACAMARETQLDQIASQPPGSSAWSRVLARFGNPRTVALRLWRDAMQEKLTMQRWLAGGMIALAIVLSAGLVLGFRILRDQQQLLVAQQELTAEALRQLTARAGERPAQAANEIEWVPVEIRLEGTEPGEKVPPGFRVRMSLREKETSMPPWEGTSDETGVVRFPKVRYGVYDLEVDAPWGESLNGRGRNRFVNVNPGTPFQHTVRCPRTPPELFTLKPEFVVPESLQSASLWIDLPIGRTTRTRGEDIWSIYGPHVVHIADAVDHLVGSDGRLRSTSRSDSLRRTLVYDDAGDLVGVPWPDKEYRFNRPLTLWTAPNNKTLDGAEVLLRFRQGLTEPDDIRWEVDAETRRLRFVLTERGEKTVRAMLAKLEAAPPGNDDALGEIVARYAVPSPLPLKRP